MVVQDVQAAVKVAVKTVPEDVEENVTDVGDAAGVIVVLDHVTVPAT
jgi:hypothetical protein